jgi:hypothetical protein
LVELSLTQWKGSTIPRLVNSCLTPANPDQTSANPI